MTDFLAVLAADLKSAKSAAVFETLGGRAINPRMGIVPWAGTSEQLYQRLKGMIFRILFVVSLSADFLLLGI